jgi:8-oxo-dGTP diphosphatase
MHIEKAMVAADIIIEFEDGSIVLIKRAYEPYKDQWALPGGIMDPDESIEETAVREAKEETGLDVEIIKLVGVYSKPGRDSRGRSVSVCYAANVTGGELKADTDAKEILRTKDILKMKLAFDHNQMVEEYFSKKK